MTRLPITIAAIALCVSLIGCGAETPAGSGFQVTGHAHAGPTCPVVHNPPDPACDDRPVVGASLAIIDAGGREVTVVETDVRGIFEATLPAGRYTLVPQPVEGLMGTAPSQDFTLGDGPAVVLDVAYDTGIR